MFASPTKLGRLPLSYTHVWYILRDAATKAGIGHVSSRVLRRAHRGWLELARNQSPHALDYVVAKRLLGDLKFE